MNQYIAEIRIFTANFAPKGWAQCDGQLLDISKNSALFSILGVHYGGDGKTTFGLPNLMGRSTMSTGRGQGLSDRLLGEFGGHAEITLLESELPQHIHLASATARPVSVQAENAIWSHPNIQLPAPNFFATAQGAGQFLDRIALNPAGADLPHNNLMPYLKLNYCIALEGEFPPR